MISVTDAFPEYGRVCSALVDTAYLLNIYRPSDFLKRWEIPTNVLWKSDCYYPSTSTTWGRMGGFHPCSRTISRIDSYPRGKFLVVTKTSTKDGDENSVINY